MTKENGRKLSIDDLHEKDFEDARGIIHSVVASQDLPANTIGYLAIAEILSGFKTLHGLHDGLDVGLDAWLRDGLDAWLRDGLSAGLRDGLDVGLDVGLYAGLYAGLRDGLHAGLDAGLHVGLHDGLYAGLHGVHDGLYAGLHGGLNDRLNAGLSAGLHDGLYAGLHAGLRDGLHDGLRDGLHDGLHDGLYAGLDDGLRDGLHDGLYAGLHAGLHAGLRDGLHDGAVKPCYTGVFWSFWLTRYLIAKSWGCQLDEKKLFLLRAFCLLCPIIGEVNNSPIILPKPTKIRWNVSGKTDEPFYFPIYELHANGTPAVEYPLCDIKLYYWHNVRIPRRMGEVNCEKWDPRWIFDEQNAEVRRILISEIGYERMLSATNSEVIDSWNGYELVDAQVDLPVKYRLLKMTCPSTGDVHVLRARPTETSAESAITWANHGVHPNEFGSQT